MAPEPSVTNGLTQRDLLLEVRQDVRAMRDSLTSKVNYQEFRRLEDRVNHIDRDGSHGLREMQKEASKNSTRLDTLEAWRNRQYGMYALLVFVVPVIAAISWHLLG